MSLCLSGPSSQLAAQRRPSSISPLHLPVAISNNRILKLEDAKVTFKYKESATDRIRLTTVTAEEFTP